MATAEELLAQMEENPELYADSIGPVNDVIVINAEERTIELPESEKIFGVESDKASERKYFKCPKIVGDNIDLSTLNLFINFKNANNEGDIYPIDDVEVNGDYITFSWLLSKKVTAYKTDASKNQLLSFIFCAKSGEGPENEWNTTICSDGIVLEGLEPGETITEDNPDIIQYILERLDSAGTITPEQISRAVEEYFASNPIEESDPTVPAWAKDEAPDKTLSKEGKAADAKEVGDRLGQLSDEIANKTGTGLSTEAIDKLEEVGNYLAYTTSDGGLKWTELIAILRNGSSGGSGETVPATGISLNNATLSFTTTATQTLTATIEPSNSTDKITWESSNTGIATVANGVVTPISNGSCTITATAGSVSASCEVTVSVESEIVTYTITNNLTNVSTDNPVTTVNENSGYTANLTPSTDYEFESVTVTMGGVDVTSSAYANGVVIISSVTGNVVITAIATEETSGELVYLDYVELSGGAYFDTGIVASMENKYLIGFMSPSELSSTQYIWGTRGRNHTNLDTSDYYDDVISIDTLLSCSRRIKGNKHKMQMYDSTSMQGVNGSDNKNNLVPWYMYNKYEANSLEGYSNEEMTSPLGADTFISATLTSNYFKYALNTDPSGTEITLDVTKFTPSNVYLGKVNTTLGMDNMSNYPIPMDGIKYYCYKVWSKDDVLLMNLRPCKQGSKVGMYDEVSSTFIESPEGTVTAGSEVA